MKMRGKRKRPGKYCDCCNDGTCDRAYEKEEWKKIELSEENMRE